MIDQRDARRDIAFGGVPALEREVAGKHFALESRAHALGGADPPRHDTVAEKTLPAIEQHEHRQLVARQPFLVPRGNFSLFRQLEPEESVRRQCEQIRKLANRRKRRAAHQLDRYASLVSSEIQLDRLRRTREIRDAKDRLVAILAQVRQYFAIAGPQKRERSAAEGFVGLAGREHPPHPVQ